MPANLTGALWAASRRSRPRTKRRHPSTLANSYSGPSARRVVRFAGIALRPELHCKAKTRAAARSSLTHGPREQAGDVGLRPLAQQRLAVHHVIDAFIDIGRMIAHTLEILGAKQQMNPEGNGDGIFHHLNQHLPDHP